MRIYKTRADFIKLQAAQNPGVFAGTICTIADEALNPMYVFQGGVWNSTVTATTNPLTGGVGISAGNLNAIDLTFSTLLYIHGFVGDGVAFDDLAIQAALDGFGSIHSGQVAKFPAGITSVALNAGLNVDISLYSLDCSGIEFVLTGAITGLSVNGTAANPLDNRKRGIRNFSIRGSAAEDFALNVIGQRGICHNNPSAAAFGNGPSNYEMSNYRIYGCDVGEEYGNGAWGITHTNWCVQLCVSAGIKSPSGLVDAYELPVYFGGVLNNNVLGIDLASGQLTFIGSSIDYNRKQASVGGRLTLRDCHVETDCRRATYPANHRPFSVSGIGSIVMSGGRLAAVPGTGTQIDYMFDVATAGNYDGGIFLDRVTTRGIDTSTGYLATGAGTFVSKGMIAPEGIAASVIHPKGVHATKNMLLSGGFEAGFPADDWFISAGGTATSRVVSTNVSMAISAAAARNGSNGLIVTKNTAAGASGTADICVYVPIEGQDRIHSGRIWLKAPTSTAVVQVQFGYFASVDIVAGTDVVKSLKSADTLPLNVASGNVTISTSWQEVYNTTPYRRPLPGQQYVGFRIRVHALGTADVLYIDDVEIHAW